MKLLFAFLLFVLLIPSTYSQADFLFIKKYKTLMRIINMEFQLLKLKNLIIVMLQTMQIQSVMLFMVLKYLIKKDESFPLLILTQFFIMKKLT